MKKTIIFVVGALTVSALFDVLLRAALGLVLR